MTFLHEYVEVERRFMRSANISRDINRPDVLDGYVLTPLVQNALAQILEGLNEGCNDRAFTLTGTYGTGKSSFALYLYHLLSAPTGPAWDKLKEVAPELQALFHEKIFGNKKLPKRGFVVLPVTSHRSTVTQLLAEAMEHCPDDIATPLRDELDALKELTDVQTTLRIIEKAAQYAVQLGYSGLFLIFDEFGKVFEKAYSDRRNSDISLLQELAEAASRSGSSPLFFIGLLHQSFESYVEDIRDSKTRNEFEKIEGRFRPLVFLEPVREQVQLIARAIHHSPTLPTAIRDSINKTADEAIRLQLHLSAGMSESDFRDCIYRAWPIHPVALLSLPILFQHFGQNERSIFTFLTGNMPLGFRSFLETSPSDTWLGTAHLFDYLMASMEAHLGRSTQGKSYLEANDILSRKKLPPEREGLVKAVAVLSSIGKKSQLKASTGVLSHALQGAVSAQDIDVLVSQSILVHRRFTDSYHIWEGSDVDLHEREKQADKALTRKGFSMAHSLKESLPPHPFIAKRHSFETGALRYFHLSYVDSPDDLDLVLADRKAQGSASGRILLCLASSDAIVETYRQIVLSKSEQDTSLIFAIPRSMDELRGALYEMERLRWIVDNTEELMHDHIALREIGLRQAEAKQKITQLRQGLLDPREAPQGCGCLWIWQGKERTPGDSRGVSSLLSEVCDRLYTKAPRVLNELINRQNISAQAAAARNNIVKRLISPQNAAQAALGIDGYPPERSIYESLLFNCGLHMQQQGGQWQLVAPEPKQLGNLFPCWQFMEERIFTSTVQPLSIEALYQELRKAPYGVMDGIMPILLTLFFVLNRREVTLYQEGTFLPDPQEAHLELMIRRPDLFAIAGARITGLRLRIVERLAKGLHSEASVTAIVRHLYRMLGTLSKYARTTHRVSRRVSAFRKAFEDARSPERLLFYSIPNALELPPVSEQDDNDELYNQYFERLNNALGALAALLPELISEQRTILLEACDLEPTREGWTTLYERACLLAPKINNTELLPFLQNIINTTGNWNKADAVMAYMISVPMGNWTTIDIRNFAGIAKGKGMLLKDAWAPYSSASFALSSAEQRESEKLQAHVFNQFHSAKASPAVMKATLLACLRALESPDTPKQ